MLSEVPELRDEPCSYTGSACDLLVSPKPHPALMKQPEVMKQLGLLVSSLGLLSWPYPWKHLSFVQGSGSLVGSTICVGSFLFKKSV